MIAYVFKFMSMLDIGYIVKILIIFRVFVIQVLMQYGE